MPDLNTVDALDTADAVVQAVPGLKSSAVDGRVTIVGGHTTSKARARLGFARLFGASGPVACVSTCPTRRRCITRTPAFCFWPFHGWPTVRPSAALRIFLSVLTFSELFPPLVTRTSSARPVTNILSSPLTSNRSVQRIVGVS